MVPLKGKDADLIYSRALDSPKRYGLQTHILKIEQSHQSVLDGPKRPHSHLHPTLTSYNPSLAYLLQIHCALNKSAPYLVIFLLLLLATVQVVIAELPYAKYTVTHAQQLNPSPKPIGFDTDAVPEAPVIVGGEVYEWTLKKVWNQLYEIRTELDGSLFYLQRRDDKILASETRSNSLWKIKRHGDEGFTIEPLSDIWSTRALTVGKVFSGTLLGWVLTTANLHLKCCGISLLLASAK
ncbi:hypothetical protein BGW38_001182 [Lunasporangiospora selenospora]|uniref:Uncharacterized protein n=1 Tax=Lunasporangiospora selenospora TaxID=979761 RepID=A0A9P6KI30_9FUNG|nr:hypothetical protein BGW38_001182 [Lunasporangiospora selenospora]